MAITLQQLIANYCVELLRAHSTFLVLQRSAYLDIFANEYNRLALNDSHFLGLDEVSFSLYLYPRRRSRLVMWWYRMQRRPLEPLYKLVHPSHPGALQCTVVFRRQGSEFKNTISLEGQNNVNRPIYVDLT
ncbi:MAG: hypothetical protein ACP5PZ_10290 [Bacteroidales bacterium]